MMTLRETIIQMIGNEPGITTDEIKWRLGATAGSPYNTLYVCEADVPTFERILGIRSLDNSFAY